MKLEIYAWYPCTTKSPYKFRSYRYEESGITNDKELMRSIRAFSKQMKGFIPQGAINEALQDMRRMQESGSDELSGETERFDKRTKESSFYLCITLT